MLALGYQDLLCLAGVSMLPALQYDDGSGTATPPAGAAFGLSCRRLDDTTARIFRLLAICPGPDVCTPATAVLADLPVNKARAVLAVLARAHLIEPVLGKAGRWQMHDLVHLYASELSGAHADEDGREQARDRLLGYYMDMTEAADAHLRALPGTDIPGVFAGREDALAWLDAERASLIPAVQMAADTGRDQAALRLPLLLGEYLCWRGRFDDWLATTVISLITARRLGDLLNEAATLSNLGLALDHVRRFDEAIAAHQGAAAIFRKTHARHSEAAVLCNLGNALEEVRRFDEAVIASKSAADIFRETGDRTAEAKALDNLGRALREVCRFEEAITAHLDALAIFSDTNDGRSVGKAMTNISAALLKARLFEEAIVAAQDAVATAEEFDDRRGRCAALDNLGLALNKVGRVQVAIDAHQQAALVACECGDLHSQGMSLNNLGIALQQVRRFEEAITAHQVAAAIFRETGDQHSEGMALENLERTRAAHRA